MHELFGCLNAKPNDPHEQENHSVEFFSGISLETLQPCPLDGFDLLFDDAKSLHLTLKRCDRIGWQRNSLGCSHRLEFLRRFAQDRVEVATPNCIRIDFIRLTVLVRCLTRISRSRCGHLPSSSATVGTIAMLQWPRSPRNQPRKPRCSIAVSIRSVLARRCSRDTATLVAWITWASMPRVRSHRASQKPSRPVSYATAIRVISFPA